MKIEVLRNLGPGLPDYTEGQVVEVEDEEGANLVGKGLARGVSAIKGVPKAPEITAPLIDEEGNRTKSDSMKRFSEKSRGRKRK